MPLLNKKPLELHRYNKKLKDDVEVFHCTSTNEIFEDYEEYCQRVISCNSLIWTCAITGKSNLTYQEALQSEENALQSIKDFPLELRTPALYLASKTRRSNFNELVEDVFNFVKNRYFLGESVEVNTDDEWKPGHVLSVTQPSEDEVKEYCRRRGVANISSRPFPGPLYKYEVEELDDFEEDPDIAEIKCVIVTGDKIRRRKGVYTKDKNRIYLKQFAELKKGINKWGIQDNILAKYSIPTIKFSRIFVGEPPLFESAKKQGNNVNKMAQTSMKNFLVSKKSPEKLNKSKSSESSKKFSPKKVETNKKTVEVASKITKKYQDTINKVVQQARKDAMKQQAIADKARKLEEVKKKREKERAEKAKLADFVKEWQRKRDDLECEDLKDLPPACPVDCKVPNEHFGDFIMILEFFHNFRDVLKVKDYFPYGLKFELVERALVDVEIAGPFCDILQLLLQSLFSLQEQEDDEIQSTGYHQSGDLEIDESGDISTAEAIKLATVAANWSRIHHGVPLNQLSLDAITVTEILRLHLLSSGGRAGDRSAKWRYQERGGYTSTDDPGLVFRLNEPHILRFLSVKSVAELSIGDKFKVLTCLMNQILTYAELRDVIEDRLEKVKAGKNELKNDQIAEAKREKEAIALKIKEKKEAKEKGEAVPEMSEVNRMKNEKDAMRKKQEFHKRLIELHNAAMGCQVLPLGQDRGYRRFWIFSAIPGLFVEDDEKWPGVCLPEPTPSNHSSFVPEEDDTMSYVRKLFEEEKSGGSDKENEGDSSHPVASPKKKHLGESNGPSSLPMSPVLKSPMREEEKQKTLVCTANKETCPVHGLPKNRTKWFFYYKESDIDELINCLNKRGNREHRLRKALVEDKDRITQELGKCPVHHLNRFAVDLSVVPNPTKMTRSQKGYENANLKYPLGTPVQEILELYLRELIVDTEEKIYCGGLGTLKVKNRETWRIAIEGRSYDRQDDNLAWFQPAKKDKNVKSKEEDTSRPDTPCSMDSSAEHDVLSTSRVDQNQTVKDLASAVLQIGRSVEPKYLQKPLPYEERRKEKPTAMERWESSLMTSTSFAQVYLHIATLENSIQWNKSALNARCKVCRKGGDAENMLLCDGCDRGFHLYCLKPKLNSIPKGDWFCLACRPKERTEKARKSRRLFSEESDDDDEDNMPLMPARTTRRREAYKRKLKQTDDDLSDEPLAKVARSSRRSANSYDCVLEQGTYRNPNHHNLPKQVAKRTVLVKNPTSKYSPH